MSSQIQVRHIGNSHGESLALVLLGAGLVVWIVAVLALGWLFAAATRLPAAIKNLARNPGD